MNGMGRINKMSISLTKKASIKAQEEVTLLMEEKLLFTLQQFLSVNNSYQVCRAILNPNVPFDDLEELLTEVSPEEDDYESWEDEYE